MKKISVILGLLFSLLLTFLLSSPMILHNDFFFLSDQGRDYLLVKDIVLNKKLALIGTHSGLGGFFHGPLWLYMLSPFFVIGGGNPIFFAYFYILIALITVSAGFIVGYKLYGVKFGLLVAFLLSISPSIWSYVPNTIGINVVPLVFIGLFYFLVKYIRGDYSSFIFAAFFTGLVFQFESAIAIVLLPVVIATFFLKKNAIRNLKVIFLSLFAFIFSMATFILFDLRHQFLMLKSLLGLFNNNVHNNQYLEWIPRIKSHWSSLMGVYKSVFLTSNFILYAIAVLILAYFLFIVVRDRLYKRVELKEIILLALFPLFIFIPYLIYPYTIYGEYVLGLTIPVVFAFCLIVKFVNKEIFGKVLVGTFIILSVYYAFLQIGNLYFKSYQRNQTSGSYLNQKEVVDWIFKDSKGEKFGYFVYTPETFTYGMDYLMQWVGKNNGYIPQSEKIRTTYLILYPYLDNDKGAYDFWKKNRIRTQAKIVEKKTLNGGIIVERLEISKSEPEVDPNYYQNLIFR